MRKRVIGWFDKIRDAMHSRGFLCRLLLVMVSVICIPLMALSALWITDRKDAVLDNKYAELSAVAGSVATRLDAAFQVLRTTDIKVKMDDAVLRMMDDASPLREAEAIGTLKTLSMLMPFVDEFGYYVAGKDALFMSGGKYIPGIYAEYVAGNNEKAFYETIRSATKACFQPWNEEKKYFTYVIPPLAGTSGGGITGYYRFTAKSVMASLDGTLIEPFVLTRLESRDGTLLYAANSGANSAIEANVPGKYMNVTVGVDYAYIEAAVSQMNSFSYLLVGICALVLIVDVLALLTVGYAPVYRLFHSVRNYSGVPCEGQGELEYMMEVVESAVNKKQRMQARMRREHRMLEDRLVEALIKGRPITDEEVRLLPLGDANALCVICVRLRDLTDLDERMNGAWLSGARYLIEMLDDGVVALVYGLPDASRGERMKAANSARMCLKPEGTAALGVGGAFAQPKDAAKSYREALAALAASNGDDRCFEDAPCESKAENRPASEGKAEEKEEETIHEKLSAYTDAHFTEANYCTSSVAQHFGISEYMAGKLMRELYGANYSRLINERRLEYAKELLYVTSASVTEIAQKAGFMSSTYFGRVFRGAEGMSPTVWRQRIQSANAQGSFAADEEE